MPKSTGFDRRCGVFVAVILASVVFESGAWAAEKDSPAGQLGAAAQEFVGTLKGAAERLHQRPERVEPTKWDSIRQGALEIRAKVLRLREMIQAAEKTGEELGVSNGRLQARLEGLVAEYKRLADEAGKHAGELREPLASTVKKEASVWKTWAQIAEEFSASYKEIVERYQKQAQDLKAVAPILARLAKGADQTVELASLGEQLDQQLLATFAEEVNHILDSFNTLADQTQHALAKADPSGSLFLEGAKIASSDQGGYQGGGTASGAPVKGGKSERVLFS